MIGQEEMASSCIRGGLDERLGKILFSEMIDKCWKKLPMDVFDSSSLEVFKRSVDVMLMDMV